MSFAKVTLIGNLGRDPEVRYTPDGRALASTSIAVTRKTKNGEETDWYRVTFGGKLGEIAGQYLKKGRQVYVEGRLKLNKYTDRDGNERHSLDVDATEMQMIGSRDAGEGGGGGGFGGGRESGGGGYSREPAGGGGGYGRESGGGARPGGSGAARPAGGGSRPAPEPSFGDDDDIPF